VTVICQVSFAGAPAVGVTEATFRHAEFEHEQALLVLEGRAATRAQALMSGSPMLITWGSSARPLRALAGYVSHIKPGFGLASGNKGPDKKLGVYCVGASYLLKQGGYYTGRNVTAPVPVRLAAEQFRMETTFIDQHSQIWPVLAQAGRSHWQFLVECAKRMGWTLYVHGTTLYCHERTAALRLSQTAPVFSGTTGSLHDFHNSVGATSPEGGAARDRHAYGVNPRTGVLLRHTNKANTSKPVFGTTPIKPLFGQGQTALVVDTLAEAHDRLKGEELGNRLTVEASMTGTGDQSVRVGRALGITGLSVNDNGYWYVKEYTQTIRTSLERAPVFTIEATLGRDSERGYVIPPPGPQKAARGSRLVSGRWVAA
jgi:hypothetical protein